MEHNQQLRPELIKPKCVGCGKPLVAIGNSRKNGKAHNDWPTRKYHKKCWREL